MPVELPWLDIERSFFIAVNRMPGADVGIALDFRTSIDDPRVVAGDCGSGKECVWREVALAFSAFARMLGLVGREDELGDETDRGAWLELRLGHGSKRVMVCRVMGP